MGELFSGPGGIARGAHDAAKDAGVGLYHAWASDYDASTVETYRQNIPGATAGTVRHEDVRNLDIASLGSIDGFAFGFPCNDYSLVGQSKGLNGTFGPLFRYGIEVLDAYQPQWFVAENVSGLRSSNGGEDFAHILDAMRGSGYKLTPHLYRFEEYGVPQRRHRVIIVGLRDDLAESFRVPAPTHVGQEKWVTAGEALAGIPLTAANQERTRQSEAVVRRLELIEPGENAFNAKGMTDEYRLNVKGATLSQIYRRLRPDRPSYTITGSGGGGTHGYHWAEPRALTNRERARIQTFPDEFVFKGTKESVRKQVGMAVPPEGARAIFRALFQTLKGESYATVRNNIDPNGRPQ